MGVVYAPVSGELMQLTAVRGAWKIQTLTTALEIQTHRRRLQPILQWRSAVLERNRITSHYESRLELRLSAIRLCRNAQSL